VTTGGGREDHLHPLQGVTNGLGKCARDRGEPHTLLCVPPRQAGALAPAYGRAWAAKAGRRLPSFPLHAAARLLYHLDGIVSSKTGFSWDDCPLPYPMLCEDEHRGELDRALIEAPVNDTGQCRCGKPLTGRVDAKYCSPRCRLHAFRQKGLQTTRNRCVGS
jgi:hypothetical protein